MTKRVSNGLLIAFGILFLGYVSLPLLPRAVRGQNDFVQLYTGAKLAGTPLLYSRAANLAVIQSTIGFTMDFVTYTRPPFYAALLRPLALVPYRAAYAIFVAATLSSLLWFVLRFSKEWPPLAVFAAFSVPAVIAICNGQDTPLLLAILGGSILLTRENRHFRAGLLLSLCAIKFHLFLFLPLLLLVKKRWAALAGLTLGAVMLTAFGALVTGFDALGQYLGILRNPWMNPNSTLIPNIHGLAASLRAGTSIEIVLLVLVAAVFLWTAWKNDNYEFLFALTLICGLLSSFHSGIHDDVLLLLAFALIIKNCCFQPLRIAMALMLTPIPYLAIYAGPPYSAVLPAGLLVVAALFPFARIGRPAAETVPSPFYRPEPNPSI